MATLKEARAQVAADITAAGITGVRVYGFEPPAITDGTAVTVVSAGIDPTDWLLDVRVYVSATAFSPQAAQDRLDDVSTQVDAALDSSDAAPRGHWTFGFDQEMDCFVGTAPVSWPREDF